MTAGNGDAPSASRTTVARFSVERIEILGKDGRVRGAAPDFARDPAALIPLYRAMVLARTFDAKAIALQRTGRLGTYASALGQEAVAIGTASAMRPEDILLPSFREHGAQIWRGVTLTELFLYWGGDERGSDFAGPREDFPVCVPVASQMLHAVGVALAMKLRGEERAAVCIAGDGATSKGEFYEALNLAGVWALPVVFLINNNQWAISVPREAQTAAETLAQKAIAAGVDGVQVDGNDVIAVRQVIEEALAKARTDGRPALVEALTYRLGDHTTADDARRYRDDAAVSPHWEEEPVVRLRTYLSNQGVWGKEQEEGLLEDCAAKVEAAAEEYLATAAQPPTAMFDHLYAELPADLREQRRDLSTTREQGGG